MRNGVLSYLYVEALNSQSSRLFERKEHNLVVWTRGAESIQGDIEAFYCIPYPNFDVSLTTW